MIGRLTTMDMQWRFAKTISNIEKRFKKRRISIVTNELHKFKSLFLERKIVYSSFMEAIDKVCVIVVQPLSYR
jgi:hypothetical protein